MNSNYKFNTADYEEVLVDAGLEKPLAKAHRVALQEALEAGGHRGQVRSGSGSYRIGHFQSEHKA